MLQRKTTFTTRELRQFAGLWFPLLCGMIGFFCWRGAWTSLAIAIWCAGAGLGLLGLVHPPLIRPVFQFLLWITFPIGWVVSHLILALVFYVVITPIGLVMRLLGRDPMQRRLAPARASYWIERQPTDDVQRYFKQF